MFRLQHAHPAPLVLAAMQVAIENSNSDYDVSNLRISPVQHETEATVGWVWGIATDSSNVQDYKASVHQKLQEKNFPPSVKAVHKIIERPPGVNTSETP